MDDSVCGRIVLLTPEGFEALREPRGAGARLAAIAEGRRFAEELPERSVADDARQEAELPYQGRFCYRWVVVDFGHADDEARAQLIQAFARIDPSRAGLLLSDREHGELPAHVHTLPHVLPDEPRVRDPWFLVQLCRFFLRALGPTRVLFLDLRDAALLAEVAGLHGSAVLCSSSEAHAVPRAAKRASPKIDDVLAWLREPDGPTTLAEASRRAGSVGASAALDAAATLVLTDARTADLAALLRRCPRQGLLSAGPGALATVLAPDGMRPAPPTAPSGEIRVVVHDVTGRDPRQAPVRAGFSCLHLLGDMLAATPVLRAYRRRNPDAHVTVIVADRSYARVIALCPSVDRILYVSVEQEQLVYGSSTEFVRGLPFFESDFDERFVLDIQAVARHPDARGLHMSDGYALLSGVEIESRRPAIDAQRARALRLDLGLPARHAVLVRNTVSGAHIGPDHAHSKRWKDTKWVALARALARDHGLAVLSIGTPEEPRLGSRHAIDLHCLAIEDVAALLADAALVVSVDNGIYHLAQGVGTPTVHLYPSWLDRNWTACDPDGPSIDLHVDLRRLTVSRVLEACARLLGRTDDAPEPRRAAASALAVER